jgi:ATP-dependent exoDNAse (exonuclease V) alpha subunit
MVGDFRQLPPVNDRIKNADYKNSRALKELCNFNRIELTKCRRSDDELFKLSKQLNEINPKDYPHDIKIMNLCFTNEKREMINDCCSEMFIKQRKKKLKHTFQLPNGVRVCTGMPIISKKNLKQYGICNNEMFTVTHCRPTKNLINVKSDIDSGKIMEFDFKEFSQIFELAFGITVHKSQGTTIDRPFTIHEWSKYSREMKYVALTRATKKSDINFAK